MVAIRSRASCFSLSKVSSSKAINLRTTGPASCVAMVQSRGTRNRSGTDRYPQLLDHERRFPDDQISVMASAFAIAILAVPVGSLAQSSGGGGAGGAGGAASGPSSGTGSAAGSPNAGSAGAGTAGVNGVPSGPANAGGLNNSVNDPSGAGNSGKVVSQPPPGTNSLGTANSSGSSMTTGSAGGRAAGGGTAATGSANQRRCCRGQGRQGDRQEDQEHLQRLLGQAASDHDRTHHVAITVARALDPLTLNKILKLPLMRVPQFLRGADYLCSDG